MLPIAKDFLAAGKPTYIVANAGVTYLDIEDGIRYRQTTIPYGKNWVQIAKELVYYPGSVTSVGLSVPSPIDPAFGVTGSPVTTGGTINLVALGKSTQYVKGDGSLGDYKTVTGRVGDVYINETANNYEVQNVIVPFLLMGA